tara:strand:- start:488 stop:751 length:264 start_codon:yes stop_codon:yes gene_type:complete
MDKQTVKKLIKKKLLAIDTEVEVKHLVKDFGDSNMEKSSSFNIVGITDDKFVGTSTEDGSELRFNPEQIVAIDGMSPKRLCDAFKIK